MKKLLSLVLSIVMAFAISVPAFATSAGPDIPTEPAAYTVTVNEYDVYVAARTASNDELLTRGISENQISLARRAAEQGLNRVYPAGVVLGDADQLFVLRASVYSKAHHRAYSGPEADEQAAA